MHFVRFAFVVLVSAVVVACGGSDGSTTTAPLPTSPTPSPTSPTPSPTSPTPPGNASASVAIPVGAQSLGTRAYMPDELSVATGSTVTWMNTDSVSHTSTSDESGWNSGTIAPGGRFSFTFQQAGTYKYHCTIHPGMVGTVVVR